MMLARVVLLLLALAAGAHPAPAGGLRVRLLPGERLRVGDVLRIEVTSAFGGWLYVYDVRATGETVRLFPGACNHGRRIRPGSPLIIPSRASGCAFTADAPGKGRIAVIVSRKKIEPAALAARLPPSTAAEDEAEDDADAGNWRTIEIVPFRAAPARAGDGRDLAQALARITTLKKGAGDAWAAAAAPYEIRR